MIQKARHGNPKPGRMLLISLLLHLSIVLIFSFAGTFKPVPHEATPYYVDIVSLPALAPAPGNPEPLPAPSPAAPSAAVTSSASTSAAAKAPVPPAKPAMKLSAKISPLSSPPVTVSPQGGRDQEALDFAQRMSRLERSSDAKHQAEALALLQKRVTEKRGAGGATAAGSDKGSDYGAYIQSRLQDALATTMVYQSKAPEAAVRLYIDKKGKLLRYVMERPSADKLFNDSVIRTIEKAKVNFPPTPTNAGFDKLFVFSPQEVNK